MPGMPGSFSSVRVPVAVMTYVARNSSPRSVVTSQFRALSSQVKDVTDVEKRASAPRSNFSAIRTAWRRISSPGAYFHSGT